MASASDTTLTTVEVSGALSTSGSLSRWYAGMVSLHEHELHEWAGKFALTTFYSSTALPRKGFSITRPLGFSNIQIGITQENVDHVVDGLLLASDEHSYLYHTEHPVALIRDHNISLRNCALVEFVVTVTSGLTYNLNSISKFSEKVPDAPVLAANYFGDVYCYESDQVLAASGVISFPTYGAYSIRFEHQPLFQRILSGGLITVNGRTPKPEVEFYTNVVDRYAALVGLKRKDDEDNLSLRARCQNLSLSRNQVQCISASLGTSTAFIWDTGYDLTIPASGTAEANIPLLSKYVKVVESPIVDSNRIILVNHPVGAISLRVDNQLIEPETYSVSGNTVTVHSGIVKTLMNSGSISERVTAEYRTQQLTTITSDSSGGSLFLDVPKVQGQMLVMGTVPTNVTVEDLVQTNIEFRWGRGHRSNAGLGTFGGYYSENNSLYYK